MKVAVLGPSRDALDMTRKLLELGASVRLYWGEAPSSAEELRLSQAHVLSPHPWRQVTKRFLGPGATPPGKSRFLDLFRVTHSVNPAPLIAQGKQESPELYERMSDEFLVSLQGHLEMFDDFDVVIDASPAQALTTLGPGGPAVGEGKLRPGTLLSAAGRWEDWGDEVVEVALVGTGPEAAEALMKLRPWLLKSEGHRLFVIGPEQRPFATAEDEVRLFLTEENRRHALALERHAQADAEWLELDDFIKAKKPRPEVPIPRLVFFAGHRVTVVDQLIDRPRTFLTCEVIPWAPGEVQVENNAVELKTIGVDRIVAATGSRRAWGSFPGLDLIASADQRDARSANGAHPEPGFFTLGEFGEERQLAILSELQRLFSPQGGTP